jgi:predicted metal-binding protein
MVKVGILTCANTTEHGTCASAGCLHALHESVEDFARYQEDGGAQLVGLSRCSGCPTALASERIHENVEPLVQMGAEIVHLSTCLLAACPYKNKYRTAIEEAFPQVEVVVGTHTPPPEELEQFKGAIRAILTQPKKTLGDFMSPH